jgi:hypothetical protein
MGQLIKLQDYVSRYEQNIYVYPSRYVRLKKQQWEKLKVAWENRDIEYGFSKPSQENNDWYLEEEKTSLIDRVKGLLNRKSQDKHVEEEEESTFKGMEKEESDYLLNTALINNNVNSIEELKINFLDMMFDFQMKWATSTIAEKSYVKSHYFHDERLKFFLQRFPDTYLVMYRPILLLKKAPVEIETILVSPTDVYCIAFLEDKDNTVFVGSKERFWDVRNQKGERKILNPLLALNRTEKIIHNIFNRYEIDLPVHKILLSRNGYIDYPLVPYDIKIIEKRNYEEWFQGMRGQKSPLKHMQLKGAQSLLYYCQTTSIRRMEWEVTDQ